MYPHFSIHSLTTSVSSTLFKHYQSMSTTSYQGIVALSTILPVLDIGVVGLRFYARIRSKARLQFDDWAQIPAVVKFSIFSYKHKFIR